MYAVQLYLDYGSFAQLFLQIGTRFRLGWNDAGNAFNPISIARYMAYSILLIFIVYPAWRPLISNHIWLNTFRTFLLILFVCSSVYLFFSGTKTPILALVICFLILFFKSNLSKVLKFSVLSIGIFGATFLLVAGVKVVPGLTDSQAAYIESRFLDVESAVGDRAYQGSRATDNIELKAFLIGNGTGSFGYSNLKMDIRDYPHNIFAEVLYENGIFAVILLIVIYVMIVLNCILSKDLLSSFCSFSALFFGINAFFSGDLITNNLIFFFALVTSLVKRGQLKECT
ncbi:O-antigen ligase family protein [Alteromonas arenosi]|uniref:O-antigen ligase family protein n=1 Tax=Alteromonas arenosi TaxID=3055817 RepID=UPI0025A235B2|nr:O-antigen ligase family protein [Alteromonas sp. ASW11-36]